MINVTHIGGLYNDQYHTHTCDLYNDQCPTHIGDLYNDQFPPYIYDTSAIACKNSYPFIYKKKYHIDLCKNKTIFFYQSQSSSRPSQKSNNSALT